MAYNIKMPLICRNLPAYKMPYSCAHISVCNTFQDLPQLHETADNTECYIIHSLVFSLWAGLAGTRAQSGDRYGSGTLRTRQILRGRGRHRVD
jgi:hypothetical protein